MLALLPSPLLGPATWAPVAAALGATVVPGPAAPDTPDTPHDVLAAFLAGLPDDRPLVLVPHSNAGLYVPALAAARPVRAAVFVDAALPPPGPGETRAAQPAFLAFLAGLAGAGGRLPPWTEWWGDDVAALFPDDATRRAVAAEQPRLPLAYFAAPLPVPAWGALPAAYLAFGDTYAAERARATAAGWPVETLPGEHLHQLVDPAGVAAAIERLLAALDTG